MTGPIVHVFAPSRLHFGMFSFAAPDTRQFGGVGAMIDAPGWRLKFSPSQTWQAPPSHAARIAPIVERLGIAGWFGQDPPCQIEVLAAPPAHVGLGSGTQLAMAIAAGLNAFLGREPLGPVDLARAAGRGKRSAIGLYGFAHGGLLVEAGKLKSTEISPLASRVELPSNWRFALVCPRSEIGLSGDEERQAFDRLPAVPAETTATLCRIALLELVPAAAESDFAGFSSALYHFGHLAGSCFAAQQGGAFASPRVERLVHTVRQLGVAGVAQTSWGPTIAALLPDQDSAAAFVAQLRGVENTADLDVTIAAPNNRGATIEAG